jgi:hypothetical protein
MKKKETKITVEIDLSREISDDESMIIESDLDDTIDASLKKIGITEYNIGVRYKDKFVFSIK